MKQATRPTVTCQHRQRRAERHRLAQGHAGPHASLHRLRRRLEHALARLVGERDRSPDQLWALDQLTGEGQRRNEETGDRHRHPRQEAKVSL